MTAAFTVVGSDARVLDAGAYAAGFAELGLLILAYGYAARRLRRAFLGSWSGAPALLCELVIGITSLVLVCEALGTFGAFGELELAIATGAFTAAAAFGAGALEARATAGAPP
ncbi:MAG: hypothetical protein ACR2G3_12095, partial [Solirubrobacterales bacterium]